MSILDRLGPKASEVGKKASGAAQAAAKKSGEVAQAAAKKSKKAAATARANVSIAQENDKIKKAQIELGKLYYRDFAAGVEPEAAEYLPWCDKITSSLQTIDALNESLAAMDEEAPEVEVEVVAETEPAVYEETVVPAPAAEAAEEAAPAAAEETPAEEPAPAAEAAEEPVVEEAPAEEPVPAEPLAADAPVVETLYVDETNTET